MTPIEFCHNCGAPQSGRLDECAYCRADLRAPEPETDPVEFVIVNGKGEVVRVVRTGNPGPK